MADPSRLIPDAPDPTPPMPTPNGSITMILPKVRCSSDSTTNDNSMSKSKPFVSSESKLSLPSNLGTPTSPLRLSSPLSLPASPTPFVRVTGSQPPPSTKSLGGSRQSSANTSTEDKAKERPVQPSINTGSATVSEAAASVARTAAGRGRVTDAPPMSLRNQNKTLCRKFIAPSTPLSR
ncbi:hypothetical protein JYU34_001709 [Plutella xylostella]|uniref:Uncharacterized protein n=1 Tax=Plutella xylostella TaxID=51655 RepID=A0ABQ7R4K3_PLUXY|nr:hypothetical protein JYU34_001709 [Plutella xylostella]